MNNKTITLISFTVGIAIIGYLAYNSIMQLKDIDYDYLETDEEDND
jgi:hypothetical protein